MNYFMKLVERFGKRPLVKTVPPKAPEGSALTTENRVEPIQGPAEQGQP